MLNRLPGLLLTVAVLIAIGVCFKQFDFFLLNEIKAIISVVFGFATSCLLLSFIWVIQKKPLQCTMGRTIGETPSMHPGGRMSADRLSLHDLDRQMSISTISAPHLDQPPDYEEALISSKPVNWFRNYQCQLHQNINSLPSFDESPKYCRHHHHHHQTRKSEPLIIYEEAQFSDNQDVKIIAQQQLSSRPTSTSTHLSNTNSSMTQIAMSIVKSFASIDPSLIHQQVVRRVASAQDQNSSLQIGTSQPQRRSYCNNIRKLSYCILDVNQLALSCPPPEYNELIFHHDQSDNNIEENNSQPKPNG